MSALSIIYNKIVPLKFKGKILPHNYKTDNIIRNWSLSNKKPTRKISLKLQRWGCYIKWVDRLDKIGLEINILERNLE